jgi:hypothetical protein
LLHCLPGLAAQEKATRGNQIHISLPFPLACIFDFLKQTGQIRLVGVEAGDTGS